MKTLLLAAVAAIAVSAAASAAEVEFYGATEEFAKMMGTPRPPDYGRCWRSPTRRS
jgi:opacity protein-like surface antigen